MSRWKITHSILMKEKAWVLPEKTSFSVWSEILAIIIYGIWEPLYKFIGQQVCL